MPLAVEVVELSKQLAIQGFNICIISNTRSEIVERSMNALQGEINLLTDNGKAWREHLLYREFEDSRDGSFTPPQFEWTNIYADFNKMTNFKDYETMVGQLERKDIGLLAISCCDLNLMSPFKDLED